MLKPGSCPREEGAGWAGLALCHRAVAAGDVSVAGASPGGGAEHPAPARSLLRPWGNDKPVRAIETLSFPPKNCFGKRLNTFSDSSCSFQVITPTRVLPPGGLGSRRDDDPGGDRHGDSWLPGRLSCG